MNWENDLSNFSGICRLFPLGGVVMFPHAVVPLHVFEPRYRQMSADALASDRMVTIVQPRLVQPTADLSGEPALEAVGCLGRVINHERLKDGRYKYLLVGLRRVRLHKELVVPTLYRQAAGDLMDEIEDLDLDASERGELLSLFRDLAKQRNMLDDEMTSLLDSTLETGVLADIIAHSLGVPIEMKQALLDEPLVSVRVRKLTRVLRGLVGRPMSASQGDRTYPPPFSPN